MHRPARWALAVRQRRTIAETVPAGGCKPSAFPTPVECRGGAEKRRGVGRSRAAAKGDSSIDSNPMRYGTVRR